MLVFGYKLSSGKAKPANYINLKRRFQEVG
jgi:hypothetical protein